MALFNFVKRLKSNRKVANGAKNAKNMKNTPSSKSAPKKLNPKLVAFLREKAERVSMLARDLRVTFYATRSESARAQLAKDLAWVKKLAQAALEQVDRMEVTGTWAAGPIKKNTKARSVNWDVKTLEELHRISDTVLSRAGNKNTAHRKRSNIISIPIHNPTAAQLNKAFAVRNAPPTRRKTTIGNLYAPGHGNRNLYAANAHVWTNDFAKAFNHNYAPAAPARRRKAPRIGNLRSNHRNINSAMHRT